MGARARIGQAVSWSMIDVLVRYGLNFIVLIILARILSPSDFGLVAMLALFVSVSALLIDSGFGQALIQRQQTTPTDESTVFFFTLAMGAAIALLLSLCAPWIAAFYNQPQLEQMTYWMSLNLFLNAFGTIHMTLLTKELDFKTITKAGVVAALISGAVGISMAMQDFGVWSLIGQVLSSTIATVVMLWLLHAWHPQWCFSFSSLRSFFKFGGFLLWTGLLNTLYTNLYALLIGKLHSVQDVGYYSQAQRLQQLPVNIMTNVVGRIAFPVFSAAADDKSKLARGLRKGLMIIMFINIPLMLGMCILAEPLVSVLFGDKWLPIVPVVQALSIVGLMWPMQVLNINVLKAQGHSALNARIQLIKLVIAIFLLLITSPYGLLAIAYGQVLASLMAFFINAYYSKVFLGYGSVEQIRDMLPIFSAAIPMVLCIWLVEWSLKQSAHYELFTATALGAGVYLLVCKLAKFEGLEIIIAMIRKR